LNREIRSQTITASFKEPFDLLAETVVAVRDLADDNSQCSRWWCFLNTARNFFQGQASL
jgi:hypothetical protein